MTESDKLFSIYRKVLFWGALGLAEFYLLWSLMQFVIWKEPYLIYLKRGGLALIAATVLYVVLAAVADKKRSAAEEKIAAGQNSAAEQNSAAGQENAAGQNSAAGQENAAGQNSAAAQGGKSGRALAPVKALLLRAKSSQQIFLLVFLVWYIVVCEIRAVTERKPYFTANDNRLFYTAMAAFVFFPLVSIAGRDKIKKIVDVMLGSAVAAYTPVCAWVLWNFYHGVFVILPSGNVVKLYQGLSLMIGVHRNTTAAYSLVLLSVCVYFLVSMKNRIKYVIFIPAAIVHLFVIMLSNSRTCYMVLIAMVIVTAVVRGAKYIKRIKVKNKALVVAAGILVLAAGVAALYFLRSGIIASNAETWREKLNNPDAMRVRKMVGLNGRVNIWKASVKLMFSSWDRFLFGVTPPKLPSVLWEIGKFSVKFPHCHNLFLQVGTCFGVPMMLLYIWFTFSIARRGLRVMQSDCSGLFKGAWFIPVIVFGMLLTDMLEVMTCVNYFFNMPVFFMLSGWIMAMDDILTRRTGQNSDENLKKTAE